MDLIIIFLSGIFSALGPCVLSILPLSLLYILSLSNNRFEAFLNSIFFILGFSLMFSILGVLFSAFGYIIDLSILKYFAALISFIFGLALIFNYNIDMFSKERGRIFNKVIKIAKNKNLKVLSSFIFGLAFSLVANVCASPILASILSYIMAKKDVIFGFFALFIYSLGFSVPIIVLSLLGGKGKEILEKINPKIINIASGLILIILAIYIMIL